MKKSFVIDDTFPIVTDHNNIFVCPNCGYKRTDTHSYGAVNTPPISQQVADRKNNVRRRYKSKRCFCDNCSYMWDVIIENTEIEQQEVDNHESK
jgi:C4-type Zn-finger protein